MIELDRRHLLLAALGVAATLAAHAQAKLGSGVRRTEARQVDAFDAIRVTGGVDLRFSTAPSIAVAVSGDDNLLALVETRVVTRDGRAVLEIGSRNDAGWSSRMGLEVQVQAPVLRAVQITGSGDATLDGIDAEQFAIAVRGSGDVVARGRATTLSVSIQGSGDGRLRELQSADASVAIAGSGDVEVSASRTLNASIAGSGGIGYRGTPRVTKQIAGSGEVRALR